MKFADLLDDEPVRFDPPKVIKEEPIIQQTPVKTVTPKIDLDRPIYVDFNNHMLAILKDVDTIMLLASKRKIGINLIKALFNLSVHVLEYRKLLSNKSSLVSGGTAQRMYRNRQKFSQIISGQFIPFLGGNDKSLTVEFLNEWNKKA